MEFIAGVVVGMALAFLIMAFYEEWQDIKRRERAHDTLMRNYYTELLRYEIEGDDLDRAADKHQAEQNLAADASFQKHSRGY